MNMEQMWEIIKIITVQGKFVLLIELIYKLLDSQFNLNKYTMSPLFIWKC